MKTKLKVKPQCHPVFRTFIAFILLISTSCSQFNPIHPLYDLEEYALNDNQRILLSLDSDTYPVDISSIALNIFNNTREDVAFGEEFMIQWMASSSWKTIPFTKEGSIIKELAYILPSHEMMTTNIDLKKLNFTIKKGIYRLIKQVGSDTYGSNLYAIEFSVI